MSQAFINAVALIAFTTIATFFLWAWVLTSKNKVMYFSWFTFWVMYLGLSVVTLPLTILYSFYRAANGRTLKGIWYRFITAIRLLIYKIYDVIYIQLDEHFQSRSR